MVTDLCSCAKDTALRAQKIGTEALEREVELLRACLERRLGWPGGVENAPQAAQTGRSPVISLPT